MSTPAELRHQARLLQDAANQEADVTIKRKLARDALRIAQLAEAVERAGQGEAMAEPERARRWRMRAAEFRAVAEQTTNPQAKLSRMRLAETYDRLAQHEEDRAAREAKRKPEAG